MIAVILMVAITVVLAAVVYIWVRDYSEQPGKPENAAAHVKTFDSDGNTLEDTIKVLLVKGENAPYGFAFDVGGNPLDTSPTLAYAGGSTGSFFTDAGLTVPVSAGTTWAPGQALYAACPSAGNIEVTVKIGGTVVFDGYAYCRE